MMTNDISVFLSKLLCYNRILIAGHVGPDADCIGSLLALGRFLETRGKEVYLFVRDGCPECFSFLEDAGRILASPGPEALSSELLLLVDCSDIKRAGLEPEGVKSVKNRAVLDHHITAGEPECSFGLTDPSACSASMLVYRLILAANSQPDAVTSRAILTGIAGDTGAFRHSNTNAEVLAVAGDLTERGADLHDIIKNLFLSRPKKVVSLLGRVLSGLRYFYGDKMVIAVITNDAFEDIDKRELEGINSEINSIKGLRLSALLREEEKGSFRCSFRSDGYVDCSRLASVFGGGGHRNAAGCTLEGKTEEEAVEAVLKEAENWKASFV
ncbi:MAG: bifunctional oligoribonuclease/PAP phosphatase NrnA [Abditibacteriota bacterium]|nr:bifunctional oligoribonuclease/PAP phosphatase NrnA [Abditibacteriota bacterium]